MRLSLRKINTIFVLISFILFNFLIPAVDAREKWKKDTKSLAKKEVVLSNKFKSKKLDRVKKSIIWKNNYNVLIKSDKNLDELKLDFENIDKKIKVKKAWKNKFKINIPLKSAYADQFKGKIEKWILPLNIWNFDVIEPEIVEAFSNDYLLLEENEKLWWAKYIWTDSFQEELQTKNKIQVAILDTWIDYTHIDLDDNYNSELSYDFVNEDNDPLDDNWHGTQVAWIIWSEVNWGWRYWVNSNSSLVWLKVLDLNGIGTTYDVLDAIDYAKENNIKVLNMSFWWTWVPENNPVCEVISEAKEMWIITVVSAWNSNKDISNTIPAACPWIITVWSIDKDNIKADFSDYWIDVIYAPWVDIYTTTLNNNYITQNGTSLSTAFVSWLVSKELAYNSELTFDEIVSNISNNYNLIKNSDLGNTSGVNTWTWLIWSWVTSTGTIIIETPLYVETVFEAMAISDNGLIADYSFDWNADDSTVNSFDGTIYWATLTTWKDWVLNTAYSFDWSNDGIVMDWISWVLATNEFWVSMWVNIDNLDANIWTGSDGNFKWAFFLWFNPYFRLWIWKDNKLLLRQKLWWIWRTTSSTNVLDTWIWMHIVATHNGGTWEDFLYINWTKVNNAYFSWQSNYYSYIAPTYYNTIWARQYSQNLPISNYFDWKIDNVKIYNEYLTEDQVSNLYNSTTIPEPNPILDPNTDSSHKVTSDPTATYDFIDFSSHPNESNTNSVHIDEIMKRIEENYAWDPVTLSKWEFTYNNTLMSIPWEKLNYELEVNYKNQTTYNWPVWFNWDHNYNIYLKEEANENVVFYNWKLWIFRFIKNWTSFDYNSWLRATLVNTAWVYTIDFDNWDKHTFDSVNKKIKKLEDKYGNDLNFTYTDDKLTKVTDTINRDIIYNYFDNDRLKEVVDFNWRKVEFTYLTWSTSIWTEHDLQTISLNNGTWSIKTIDFEYSTWGTDITNHNITKLIDSKDQTYVENTYDTWDRVATQKFGEWTINYTYTLNWDDITKNTITDKLWNKAEYSYNSNRQNTSVKYYSEDQSTSVEYSYEYDSNWYLIKETKPKWNGYTYSYDSKWNILEKRFKADTSLSDSSDDLVTSYTYNAQNQVLTTTNPDWIVETNTIDTNWNITSKIISWLETHTWATYSITTNYTYLTNWLADTITKPEWSLIDFNYTNGKLTEVINWTWILTQTWTISYNDYGNILSSTDAEWFINTLEYNDFNLLSTWTTAEGVVTTFEYDENNNKTKETRYLTGWVEVNSYFYYDVLDNMTWSLVDTWSWTQTLTTYKYDNNDNIIEKKVWDGATVQYNYNEFTKIEEEKIIMDLADNTKDIVTTYTYDDNNNLITKIDPNGNTATYTYDLYDRLIKETNSVWTYSEFVYNKDGIINTNSVYNSWTTLLSRIAYSYNWLWNVTKETKYLDPINTSWLVETKIVYDKAWNVIEQIDSKWNTTKNFYDNLWRLDYTIDALWNKIEYSYDKRDLVTQTKIIPNTWVNIVTTTKSYDEDGRLITETNDLNKSKIIDYNNLNQITQITDENWNITNYELDYLWNITKETKHITWEIETITSYSYDERWNLTKVTDPESNETIYEYDKLNRNIKTIYSDSKELSYTYDKNSNLLTQTDPNWTQTTNTYNNLGQLKLRNINTWTWVIWITNEWYSYDELWRLVSWYDDNDNELDFTYDNLWRLTSETSTGWTVWYTYDSNNNLTKIIHPDTITTNYSYDELNRNTTISFSWELVATYSFTWILNTQIDYGNWKTITKTYDELLRLNSLNNWIKTYNYTYDDVSNITSDSIKDYNYDDIYRITNVTDTLSWTILESFNYDKVWNRTTDLNNTYTTNTLNQYTTLTGTINTNYSYDNNWNITDDWTNTYEYDYKNRLVKVNSWATIVVEYNYDVLGRRISRHSELDSESYKYLYSNQNILEEVKTTNGKDYKKVYINWIWLDNLIAYEQEEPDLSYEEREELEFCEQRVLPYNPDFTKYWYNTIITRCNNLSNSWNTIVTNRYYFHKNHLGSIVWLTNDNWDTVITYDYDAFWKTTLVSWTDIWNTRLYTGREFDEEINLYYLRARYYNPETWRFISRDPIWQVDDVNLYAYVGNNGVMFVDLMGTDWKSVIIKIAELTVNFAEFEKGYLSAWWYHLVNWATFWILDWWLFWYEWLWIIEEMKSDTSVYAQWYNAWENNAYMLDTAAIWLWIGSLIKTWWSTIRNTSGKIKWLKEQIKIHIKKLKEYKKNPDKYDNKWFLRKAWDNKELRNKIIQWRINHLQKEINNFKDSINKLNK